VGIGAKVGAPGNIGGATGTGLNNAAVSGNTGDQYNKQPGFNFNVQGTNGKEILNYS